jgi:hypothetical protein
LLQLLHGGWDLGASTRRQLIEDLATLHRSDTFWRVGRALVAVARRRSLPFRRRRLGVLVTTFLVTTFHDDRPTGRSSRRSALRDSPQPCPRRARAGRSRRSRPGPRIP